MATNKVKKSGYVEKKINGKVIPFKFGMNSFGMFCEMRNVGLTEMGAMLEGGKDQATALRDIIFCAAFSAISAKGDEPQFNKYEVGEWIDEMPEKDLQDILEAVQSAKIMGKGLGRVADEKK